MAGGPRKFSEKIALLNQKEAEANAAFCSIMDEVSRIRPGSGSQVDLAENFTENKNNSIHSAIDEVIGYNEHVSITYEHQQYQQLLQSQQLNSTLKKPKHQKVKKHDPTISHIKSELTQPLSQQIINNTLNHNLTQATPILSSNSYLQLPNQTDSFRRAHSDSSIHNSIVNQNQTQNNQNLQPQQMPTQLSNHQNIHQNGSNNLQQQQIQLLNFSQQQQQHAYQHHQNHYHQTNSSNYQTNNFNSNTNINTNNTSNSIPYKNMSLSSNPSDTKITNSSSNMVKPSSPILSNTPITQHNDSPSSPHQQTNFLINTFKQESSVTNDPNNNFMPAYNVQHLNVHQNHHHQHQHQQQHQQQYQQPDHLNPNSNPNHTKNLNNNLLNPSSIQSTSAGGSLPDLTSFQFQNNHVHQYQQLVDYNKRLQQQNNQNHDISSQLLQPNFQQHNYVGPVKPTHNNSVSPTRGMSRYSPTSSNSNVNSIANRRPSPQRNLPLGDLVNNRPSPVSSTVQSVPSSPHQIPSINSPLPSLEFTINSQQIQNYLSGLSNGVLNSPTNQQSNILNNIIQYRNGNGITHINGLNGESLPPSPQSQQSCFNSPQGSPGPLSISPQDLNPFTTQNYDIMQKKFDSINLETNQVNFNGNNISHQQHHHQSYNNSNNLILASPPHTHNHNIISSDSNNINNNNNEHNHVNLGENLNSTESVESDIGAFVLNSRSDSISSNSSSSGNQNNDFNEIELQNLNTSSFKNNDLNISNNSHHNKMNENNNTIKTHKNSIPNIILTFSGDSVEEKNELIIKDLSNDLMYNDDLLIKHENFDLDLQMLSDSPVALDQNLENFNDDQTLYQGS